MYTHQQDINNISTTPQQHLKHTSTTHQPHHQHINNTSTTPQQLLDAQTQKVTLQKSHVWRGRLVGSLQSQVSFAEYNLFSGALL